MTTQLTSIAHEIVDAFNAADWDRFLAPMDADVVYAETGTGRRIAGPDAYVALCQGWREAMPDLHGESQRVLASDDSIAQEVLWTGTHSGPLETPNGTIPATGRPIEALATVWYTVKDGKVASVTHHLDVLTLLAQIGALPGT